MKKKIMRGVRRVSLVLITAASGAAAVVPKARADVLEGSREQIKNAVVRAAVSCYALEGAYPARLEYLEDNYGLVINHEDFIVSYEVFASNVIPDVDVLVRGEG